MEPRWSVGLPSGGPGPRRARRVPNPTVRHVLWSHLITGYGRVRAQLGESDGATAADVAVEARESVMRFARHRS